MRALDRTMTWEYRPSHESLAVYRVIVAAYVLLTLVPRYGWIGEFSDAYFAPPLSVTLLFGGFPPGWYFHGLELLILIAATFLLLGHHARSASLALGLLLLAGNVWLYSFGKIDHDVLLIVVLCVMAFSGWGDGATAPDATRPPAWPGGLLALLIGLAMFTAFLPKVTGGWLASGVPATLGHVLHNHFVVERETWLSGWLVTMDHLVLWKSLDYGTLVIEGGFLLAVLRRRAFRLFCAGAAALHLGILLSMDITFATNVLAYGAFVDWGAALRWGWARRAFVSGRELAGRIRPTHAVLMALALYASYAALGNPWGAGLRTGVVGAGALIGLAYLARSVLLHETRRPWWAGKHAR